MVEEVGFIVASVIAGLAGGFLSSWMAFNASGEEFDKRKHGNALIVGALVGMGLGLATATALPKDSTGPQIIVSLFTTFLGSVGIDRLRSSGSKMITKDKEEKVNGKSVPAATTTTAASSSSSS